MAVSVGSEPARAKATPVSSEARPTRAKATPVSRERFVMPAGYGGAWPRCRWAAAGPGRASRSTTPSRRLACGDLAGGRARQRPEHQRSRKQQAQSQIPAAAAVGGSGGWTNNKPTHEQHQRPGATVWRAPEGPEGLAAAAVGGGGAWPGFETTRRAELAARTARGRAAAHGRTKQPGPTSQARRHPEHQGSNKQPSNARAPARHSKRGRHQPTPCASALTHP